MARHPEDAQTWSIEDNAVRVEEFALPGAGEGYDEMRLSGLGGMLLDTIAPGWQTDPQMKDTPGRWARWWLEFCGYTDENCATTFPVSQVDQIVAVTDIHTWSLCAHHLLPFSSVVSIGYVAEDKVLGLSKFARIAQLEAHRPTSQEELVTHIADHVQEVTGSEDVAVSATGLHLCMAMRGIREDHARMTSSVTRGVFRNDPAARSEWFSLLERG